MKQNAGLIIGIHKQAFGAIKKACGGLPMLFCFFSLSIFTFAVHAEVVGTSVAATEISAEFIAGSATSAASSPMSAPTNIAALGNPSSNTYKPPLADPKKISSSSQLANLMGGLILIVGLIYGLSWFVKRFSQGGFMQNSTIKMLSTMPLGTRERLMLVDVGGKQILLGITATQISALHVFPEPVVNTAENAASVPSEFSQKLMAMLQKKDITQ